MSSDSEDSELAPSRHTNKTNSVTGTEAAKPPISDRELPTPDERVNEFRDKFPQLATHRLTETPGQRLRASLFEEEWRESTVEPATEAEDGLTVDELVKRIPLTWEEAVEQLLNSHEESRKTTLKLERAHEGHPEHHVYYQDAETSWMREYQKRYFAELKGWFREAIGGERPSGGSTDGEFTNPYVVLLTRTGSSKPGGQRMAPVDHAEALRSAWKPVYDTLRNTLRALGFESNEWDYYRKEEPHTSERGGGTNICYTHEHLVVIVDGVITAKDMAPVIEKHVEECSIAGFNAHRNRPCKEHTEPDVSEWNAVKGGCEDCDTAISVHDADDLEDLAAYVASYTGIQPADLLERSVPYIAWAATQWAANKNRRTRSNAAGWAATADRCKQRYESPLSEQEVDHGEEIAPSSRRGVDYECAECGSPWGINQDHETLSAARLSTKADCQQSSEAVADGGIEVPDREQELRERWPSATAAASSGIKPSTLQKRNAIEGYLNRRPQASISEILGACGLSPGDRDLVQEVITGIDRSETVGFDEREPEWRLSAIVVDDEEYSASGSGGVKMAEAVMPVDRLLQKTRLKYVGKVQSPTIGVTKSERDGKKMYTHDPVLAARHLVDLGLTEPWAAELHLEFQRRHPEYELADCFKEFSCIPPEDLLSD